LECRYSRKSATEEALPLALTADLIRYIRYYSKKRNSKKEKTTRKIDIITNKIY